MSDTYSLNTHTQKDLRKDSNRVCLKGMGRFKEVTKMIDDVIGSSRQHPQTSLQIMDYLDPYLRGRITRDELMYTVSSWFIGDNLKATALMDLINDHKEEWQKMLEDPKQWYDQYWKVFDPKSGKSTIEICDSSDKPYNAIDNEHLLGNPHGVSPGNVAQTELAKAGGPNQQTLIDGSQSIGVAVDGSNDGSCDVVEVNELEYDIGDAIPKDKG